MEENIVRNRCAVTLQFKLRQKQSPRKLPTVKPENKSLYRVKIRNNILKRTITKKSKIAGNKNFLSLPHNTSR